MWSTKNTRGLWSANLVGACWSEYRHVVASPDPKHIVDVSLIQTVSDSRVIVITVGGGGIPVVRDFDGTRRGMEAVTDKDFASADMANILGYETLALLTKALAVAIAFGTPEARWIGEITVSELRALQAEGRFPAGSMGPRWMLRCGSWRSAASEQLSGNCYTFWRRCKVTLGRMLCEARPACAPRNVVTT